jgi:hypothetical protein
VGPRGRESHDYHFIGGEICAPERGIHAVEWGDDFLEGQWNVRWLCLFMMPDIWSGSSRRAAACKQTKSIITKECGAIALKAYLT